MKNVLLAAVVSALLLASCSQEEVVENVSNPQLKTRSAESEVKVEDGILTFSNYEAYRKVYEDLHKLNKDELTVWNRYFDCYKNDVSGEEHYKCHFILN